MSKSLIIIWQYLRAFVLIYACLYAGIFLSSLLPIAIPGSIIGMLILFFLLALTKLQDFLNFQVLEHPLLL